MENCRTNNIIGVGIFTQKRHQVRFSTTHTHTHKEIYEIFRRCCQKCSFIVYLTYTLINFYVCVEYVKKCEEKEKRKILSNLVF